MQMKVYDRQIGEATRAFTLVEILIAMAVLALSVSAIFGGYIFSAHQAEWAAYSLVAESQALQRMEQVRMARWSTMSYPPIDELVATNFPVQVKAMDYDFANRTTLYVTNITSISNVSTDPPLRLIRVDTVWKYVPRGASGKIFTNTLFTFKSPDQ